MNNFLEKVLKYESFIFVLLVPVIFWNNGLYPHISSKTFFIYTAVEIMFFSWVYLLITDKSYRISRETLLRFIPLFAFILWMTLAGVFAISPSLSFFSTLGRGVGLITLYHLTALSLIVASLFKKYGWDYIISLLKYSVVGAFFLALSVWVGTDGFKFSALVFKKDAGGGFSGNSTVTATYFLFTFAMSALLLHYQKLSTTFKKFVYVLIATIIFSPVFLSLYGLFTGAGIVGTARGTMLAIIAGIGAAGVGYMLLSGNKTIKWSGISITVTGLLAFAFLWVQLITPNTYIHNKFGEAARDSRFIFWSIAQKAMNESPWFGYGPENYSITFQKYFDPQILLAENSFEGWSDRAHGMYYDIGAAGGYPAVILYGLFLLSIFCALYQKYKLNKLDRFQAAVIFGVFVAYIVNNLFTFDSNITLTSIFLLLGIVYFFESEDNNQKVQSININKVSKNILAVVLLVIFLIMFSFLVFRPAMKSKLYAETFSSPLDKRLDMYPRLLLGSSVGSDWDASGLAFEMYRQYVSDVAGMKNNKKLLPHMINDLEALISYLEKLSETNKTDYRLYITTTYLRSTLTYYTERPYNQEIIDSQLMTLEQAKKLAPTNPNIYWSTAQVKVWGGDLKGAEDAYMEGIRVAPKLPAAYNLALKYAQVIGNKKLFDELMIRAKENIPGYELK